MVTPPTSKNIRTTISMTPEVHATFQRLAKAGNTSLSRAMGEWLGDTIEAAEFMATKMEQARSAPKVVMREMHAYAMGLADETGSLMESLREKGRQERQERRVEAAQRALPGVPEKPLTPPSSNTGGKVLKGGKKSSKGQS